MEKIEGGPNWEEILGGEFSKRSQDYNFEGVQKEIYGEFENTFMMYLPRLCEHCLNPACVASCPSGSIYKREEDGIVLIDQDKCRGWRMCVSGCPYKKIYYNWKSGKAEKCIFCYPRIEAGQPTVCSETCVGRIRYLGVLLYDADRIAEAASVERDRDLYQAQCDIFLDPNDPKVIAQARALSLVIVDVTANGMTWSAVAGTVAALAAIIALRAVLASGIEIAAFRSAAAVKEELRSAAVEHVIALGPLGPAGMRPAEITTLVTRGVDALDTYFSRYLPQLVLAVIVPITILMTLLGQDLLSTVIVAVTIPLIPVFMILIGLFTKSRVDRQWATLNSLSGHFLDLVAGLPTLVILGRAKSQAQAIAAVGERYRSSTMGVLRVSFLSSLALELLATLSVALVAVSVGLRLAEGQIAYLAALFVLLLAPEAYWPLRRVGAEFHAAAEGVATFELLAGMGAGEGEDRGGRGCEDCRAEAGDVHGSSLLAGR